MNTDPFEQDLQEQPLRQPPTQWRDEILGACQPRGRAGRGWMSCLRFKFQISNFGAVWVIIFLMRFSSPNQAPPGAAIQLAISPQDWVEHRKLMAKLLEQPETVDPFVPPPSPRSEIKRLRSKTA